MVIKYNKVNQNTNKSEYGKADKKEKKEPKQKYKKWMQRHTHSYTWETKLYTQWTSKKKKSLDLTLWDKEPP